MLSLIFGKRCCDEGHLNVAMSLYEQVYMNAVRMNYSTKVATEEAAAAAENYMTQYMNFKERGL